MRESKIPEKVKPPLGAFPSSIKITVAAENVAKLIGAIGERFGAKPVTLVGKKDGLELKITVGSSKDLDRAICAFLKLPKHLG